MISIAGKRKGELVLALLKAALVAAVLMHVALFAITAIYRLSNPFGLEWMEQFATQHALSMLRGHAVYSAPSMEATSTVYTPGLALVIMIAISDGHGASWIPSWWWVPGGGLKKNAFTGISRR